MSHSSSPASPSATVIHAPERRRFEVEGQDAWLEYTKAGPTFVIAHTEVPDALSGQGIGSALVRTALDYARDESLRVVLVCPFAISYVRRHPEYRSLVVGG